MAKYLQELFGQPVAAAMTGVQDPRTIGRWTRGDQPQPAFADRLRNAFHIAVLLETAESRDTAKAWFLGMNPSLGDWSPARVLASDPEEGGHRVMRAARNFLAYG